MWFRKQTQTWYVQVDGKQIRLGKDEEEARQQYHEIMAQKGIRPKIRGKCTMGQLIDAYLEWSLENRSTMNGRRYDLKALRKHIHPNLPVEDLKPYMVEDWAKTSRRKRKLSPTTISDRISLVVRMVHWGVRRGMIEKNPIARMDRPRPRKREVYVPPERFPELIDHVREIGSSNFEDFVLFMLDSGCRAAEMFDMRIEYVDFKNLRVVFPIDESKGRKQRRVIFLPPASAVILERQVGGRKRGLVFRTKRNIPFTATNVRYYFRTLAEKMNLPGLCPTALRHSFTYARIAQGQPIPVVSKLLGHANTKQVMERYGHLDGSDFLAEQAQAINLFPSISQPSEDQPEQNPRP